ncbi:STAS domain-containing protein [Streptomyces sp. AM 2-1-1]|uniref:STAS domain-containing protein n=1 Tax=Streptomyces sp. AM 2-1-1 TaxID=3028709 RepID=UPI0023BA3322|nr:STAS domain-containing protein [Streptomyces sp. AM 2-1-1]WEH38458.1 STAS domain-containing protein [Streptomyces sp. AM 2-1-1]
MTTTPSDDFRLSTRFDAQGAVRVEMCGDLDHRCADAFLDTVVEQLAAAPGTREVRLDCTSLGTVDSSGLAALIMIRRHAEAAGVRLGLDGRRAALDRLLSVTGTLEYLTTTPMDAERAPGRAARTTSDPAHEISSTIDGVRSRSGRPTGPDGSA